MSRTFALLFVMGVTGFARIGCCQSVLAPEREAKQYRELSRKIFTTWDDPESEKRNHLNSVEESKVITALQQIIRKQVDQALSVGRHSDAAAKVLQDNIRKVQSISLETWGGSDVTNAPFVEYFDFDGNSGYCVAYAVLKGSAAIPDSGVFVEFYSTVGGQTKVFEADTTDLNQRTLFLYRVPKQAAGEERILAWGNRIGDTGVRLSARLYSFNGRAVQTIWRRDNLTAGELIVTNGSVQLEYDPRYHAPESERVRERLYFTPNGLQ